MTPTKSVSKALEFIKLGKDVSLHWRVSVKPLQIREALNTFGEYNRFNPDKVADIILTHRNIISRVLVGLESSVVIYIEFASFINQLWHDDSSFRESKPIDKTDKLLSQKMLMQELKQVFCDETSSNITKGTEIETVYYNIHSISTLKDPLYRIRFWWD